MQVVNIDKKIFLFVVASSMDIDASDQMASSAYSCGFEHPTLDYQFNICLVQLSREITDKDIAETKYFILGNIF